MIVQRYAFALALALTACGSSTPTPAADAGATSPIAAICAAGRARNCGATATCESELMMAIADFPARCAAQRDAFFACGAANASATPCAMLSMGVFANCSAQSAAVEACANADGGAAACPTVGGTYAGVANEMGCGPGSFTVMQSTAGGTCTVRINFAAADGDTFTANSDHAIDASGRGTGNASYTSADRMTAGQADMTFELSATGGRVSYNPNSPLPCTYTLTR